MSKTRGGVYYNLAESTYKYKHKNVTFVFSSDFNKRRFERQIKDFAKEEFNRLEYILGFELDESFMDIAILKIYQKIESRGFYIIGERGVIKCQSDLMLGAQVRKVNN